MDLWTPSQITTALWLDASDSGTITLSGSKVTAFYDKSPNGFNLFQTNATYQPTKVSAAQNGLDILRFATSYLYAGDTANYALVKNASSVLMFAVRKATSAGARGEILLISTSTAGSARADLIVGATANKAGLAGRRLDADSVQLLASINNVNTSGYQLHGAAIDYANSNADLYIDGSSDGSTTSFQTDGNTSNTTSARVTLGGAGGVGGAGGNSFAGDIGEIVVVENDITTTTRQLIEGYLAWKWGLQANLPSGHPYKSAAPTISGISCIIADSYAPTDAIAVAHGISATISDSYQPADAFVAAHGISGTISDSYTPVDAIVARQIDYGDMVQVFDLDIVPLFTYAVDDVAQPFNLVLVSQGDVAQAFDLGIVAPYGDVAQAFDLAFTGSGDVLQAFTLNLIDPAVAPHINFARVTMAGVDISLRITGEVSIEANEGAARIATFDYVPSPGVFDPYDLVGASVIIDFESRASASGGWSVRRAFTGIVASPEFDARTHVVTITCSDNLQRKVADLTQAALLNLTGARYHKAIQGEPANNWAFTQAIMETIPASLDADARGALRVSDWHAATLDDTFGDSRTIDGSVSYQAAQRDGIVNQITGTFQFRFNRLWRRSGAASFRVSMDDTIKYGLPLLARSTVESAVSGTGWNTYAGSGALGTGNAGMTKATAAGENSINIIYTPYPDSVDLPGGGKWYQTESDTTCQAFSAPLWLKWTQNVTETYTLTISAPESLARNGIVAQTDQASIESSWDSAAWEADPDAAPVLDGTGKHETLDYTPDIAAGEVDSAMEAFIDLMKVKILGSHRSARGSAEVPLNLDIDLSKRLRIESGASAAEGKVVRVVHKVSTQTGRATTQFDVALSGHGATGVPAVTDTATVAPAAPSADTPASSLLEGFTMPMVMHIGALASSPPEDPDWAGWIVNVPNAFNVQDPGSATPKVNPQTQATGLDQGNPKYYGSTLNPQYRADKAYSNTGLRVVMPAIESAARDSIAPEKKATYLVSIPADEFTLTA